MIAIPENPVMGNSAARAKLWTAAAINMLPRTSQNRSVISVFSFIGGPLYVGFGNVLSM